MPAQSEKQRHFMWMVHGIQKGKIPSGRIGGQAKKAAKTMNPEDVKDFLMQECGLCECGSDVKTRLLKTLKELQEPMNLDEMDDSEKPQNVITSTKKFIGAYDATLAKPNYRGEPMQPTELQAATNFDKAKATISKDKRTFIFHRPDDFGNNRMVMIRKMRDAGYLVFVAFVKSRNSEKPEIAGQTPEAGGTPEENPQADKITIIKSTPIDDEEGSEILSNFMDQVWRQI